MTRLWDDTEGSIRHGLTGQTSPEEHWRVTFKYVDKESVLIAYRLACENFYRDRFHERMTDPHIADLLVKHELRRQPSRALARGETGARGTTGETGATGERGATGPPGNPGPPAVSNGLTAEEVRRWRAQVG